MSDQRILLLTASIGSGHIKAAEAIEEEIRKLTPQTKIIKVDFMSKRTSFLHWLMKQIYLKMLALVPNIYDICYAKTSREQQDYIKYIDEQYNSERLTKILSQVTTMIGARILNIAKQDYDPQGASVTLGQGKGRQAHQHDAQIAPGIVPCGRGVCR